MQQLGGATPSATSAPTVAAIFAHQGGWDEILLVVGPLAVIGSLLYLANRRVNAKLEAAEASGEEDG